MKRKFVHGLLALVGAATLLTGCSTTNQGAQGEDTQFGGGSASYNGSYHYGDGGANGTISRSNPLGEGAGTGITQGAPH